MKAPKYVNPSVRWKAHLNVPTAMIPGHLIKEDTDVMSPIASIYEGGGTHGKEKFLQVAKAIAALPACLKTMSRTLSSLEDFLDEDGEFKWSEEAGRSICKELRSSLTLAGYTND